jgi:hypothetical protein
MADVFTETNLYREMSAARHLPRALWGGLPTMQSYGELYLPREPGESLENYGVRLRRSTLFNQFARTVEVATGKVFSKPLRFLDLPPALEPMIENIDLFGNHLDVFARDWFREALIDGIAFALVDVARQGSGPATIADRNSGAIRPYAILYKASYVIETRAVIDQVG